MQIAQWFEKKDNVIAVLAVLLVASIGGNIALFSKITPQQSAEALPSDGDAAGRGEQIIVWCVNDACEQYATATPLTGREAQDVMREFEQEMQRFETLLEAHRERMHELWHAFDEQWHPWRLHHMR